MCEQNLPNMSYKLRLKDIDYIGYKTKYIKEFDIHIYYGTYHHTYFSRYQDKDFINKRRFIFINGSDSHLLITNLTVEKSNLLLNNSLLYLIIFIFSNNPLPSQNNTSQN